MPAAAFWLAYRSRRACDVGRICAACRFHYCRNWRGSSRIDLTHTCVHVHAAEDEMTLILSLICILLSPLAAAGLALIHQGLGRSRSAAHSMLATLCVLAISAIVFVLVGASWAGFAGGAAHTFQAGGTQWNWLGNDTSFVNSLHLDGST